MDSLYACVFVGKFVCSCYKEKEGNDVDELLKLNSNVPSESGIGVWLRWGGTRFHSITHST